MISRCNRLSAAYKATFATRNCSSRARPESDQFARTDPIPDGAGVWAASPTRAAPRCPAHRTRERHAARTSRTLVMTPSATTLPRPDPAESTRFT